MVRVGCEYHDLQTWREKGIAIIRSHGFPKEKAERWGQIITLIAETHIEGLAKAETAEVTH